MALRIATRGSQLALTQSGMVADMLGGAELVEVSSDGLPGDKSRFVRAVEGAVLEDRAAASMRRSFATCESCAMLKFPKAEGI